MRNRLCFNKNFFILLILVILLVLGYQIFLLHHTTNKTKICPPCEMNNLIKSEQNEQYNKSIQQLPLQINRPPINPPHQLTEEMNIIRRPGAIIHTSTPVPPVDVVKEYDYRKAYDPLEEPTRRVNRYEIPRTYFKRTIDIPTRGLPDTFIQLGILVKELDSDFNQDNRILRLFGRQEYPGSDKYEYYTAINSGHDQIKVPLRTRRRKELYDGDTVFVKELNNSYKVQLHKYDAPRYYPDLF